VLEPAAPTTLILLGYANLSLDRYEEAKQCLQQALKLGQTAAARAHVYLAEIYAHEKNFKEAADSIKTYLKIKPDASDATHLKELEAQWRSRIKQPAIRIEKRQRFHLNIAPLPPDTWAFVTSWRGHNQRPTPPLRSIAPFNFNNRQARRSSRGVPRGTQGEARLRRSSGESRRDTREAGKYDEAISAYEAAFKLAPHLTRYFSIWHCTLPRRPVREGRRHAEELAGKKPGFVQARQLYGLSLWRSGRIKVQSFSSN
jgi:tetratricopeptide (TPR) repeat protein